MKIAIIGGGPRGLWAVEELLTLAWQRNLSFDIEVYDDGPIKAYDTAQPDYWLMNVDASILPGFREDTGITETYPPSAVVGAYLNQRWERLDPPRTVTVRRVKKRVDTTGDLDALRRELGSDFLLAVTGHDATWDGELDNAVTVYPFGSLDTIQSGDCVAIRGLALTFIDAVLNLTEGRGGSFTPEGAYTPSGQEPRAIIPFSRSGRFLNPKPDFAVDTRQVVLAAEPLVQRGKIAQAITLGAQILLDDRSQDTLEDIAKVIAGEDAPEDTVAELRANIAVATGQAPLTAQAAVGMAFQALYPAIVRQVSFAPAPEGFSDLASTLERVAFGMPVINARKILGLIDASIITPPRTEQPDTNADGVDHFIDAVLAPPPSPPVRTGRDGFLSESNTCAVIGRATEGWILGNDTLSRTLHDIIPRWARRVVHGISSPTVHGLPPLTARLEPWAAQLAADYSAADALLTQFSSPVNVLNTDALTRNVDELVTAGARNGVDVRVFFARKANKALAFVDAVAEAGHGVDVASLRELTQVLEAGVAGKNIILSAAIKPQELLRLAVANGVTISVDTVAEMHRIAALAQETGTTATVAPRLAPDPRFLPPTRFGELSSTWATALTDTKELSTVRIAGVHVHLHGYSAADRATALQEVFVLHDALRAAGHHLEFIDIGGGVPMSYIDDAAQWEHFEAIRSRGIPATDITWKKDPLETIYPYYQQPTRANWLEELLQTEYGAGTKQGVRTIASELQKRHLRLHLEPGRSLLDGCGMTLARVEFVKRRADGLPLVGLAMNRTQTRTTSDDFTIDPLLLSRPHSENTRSGAGEELELEAYLVGAYCIEDELILRRRIRFPHGVKPGDIIAIPNTAGYFMHILESASHQIPLAHNVVWPAAELDRIDLY
ncbi:MAG: FAD/NAD(P)-binding protein [Corynebacterium sp.]|nr:FAD/NAD(P)-binding protein [Corynebacterium sp.]